MLSFVNLSLPAFSEMPVISKRKPVVAFLFAKNILFFILIALWQPAYTAGKKQISKEDAQTLFKVAYDEYKSLSNDSTPSNEGRKLETAADSYKYGKVLFKAGSKNLALLMQNYGIELSRQGHSSKAKAIFIEAIPHFKEAFGEDGDETAILYYDIARLTPQSHRSGYLKKALKPTKDKYGKNSVEFADLLLDIAYASSFDKREKYMERAHRIYYARLGVDHKKTNDTAFTIGEDAIGFGDFKRAIKYLEIALEPYQNSTTRYADREIEIRTLLVQALQETGQPDRATPHCMAIRRLKPDPEYFSIYKPFPSYPKSSLRKGSSGYVILEFTIDEQGMTQDPFVVAYQGEEFIKGAFKALKKARYAPRLEKGVPVKIMKVRRKFDFVTVSGY